MSKVSLKNIYQQKSFYKSGLIENTQGV